jgi:AcrR family transcriptional regulator
VAKARSSSERTRATRQRLIVAATEIVARHGFHAATVDAIAKHAGYSIGALYWNFAGKDELFLAVFDEHVSWFERQLVQAVGAAAPGEAAAQWLELSVSRPEQFLVFVEFWAYAVRNPKVRRAFAKRMRQMRETATEALSERAQSEGKQPAIAPGLAAVVGLAIGRGLAMEKLADPDAIDDEPIAQLFAALTA